MWLSRRNSAPRNRIRNNSATFSCSSFKDIKNLCADEGSGRRPPLSSSPSLSPWDKPYIFHRVRSTNSALLRTLSRSQSEPEPEPESNHTNALIPLNDSADHPPLDAVEQLEPSISLPGAEKRIVVYLTSLRVVRSTFEDCRAVRAILRGLRVSIEERDLSMDSRFVEELQKILGQPEKGRLSLPKVFIGGRYVGGAEEIRQLNEVGMLKKLVEGLQAAEPGTCEVCDGYKFIMCDECSGSRKLYSEKAGFHSCTACNENGLIRCPSCSSAPL